MISPTPLVFHKTQVVMFGFKKLKIKKPNLKIILLKTLNNSSIPEHLSPVDLIKLLYLLQLHQSMILGQRMNFKDVRKLWEKLIK